MFDRERDYQDAMRLLPRAVEMPTLEAQFSTAVDEYRRWGAYDWERNARTAFMDDFVKNFTESTGVALENPERSFISEGGFFERGISMNADDRRAAAYEKARQTVDAAGWAFPSNDEIIQQAGAYAAQARQTAQEVSAQREAAGGSFMGAAASFAGSAGGMLTDPVMLPTMFLGAPAAAGILKTMGVEFLANAGSQAVNEALFFSKRQELAPDYTAGEALTNVAVAGAGAAVIGGGVKGVVKAYHAWRGRNPDAPVPQDIVDAVRVKEAEDMVLDSAPPSVRTADDMAAHVEAYTTALQQAARGEPVDVAAIAPSAVTRQVADQMVKDLELSMPKEPTGKSLFQFLADLGGVRDEGGELLFLDLANVSLRGKNNRKLPLVNERGLSLDEARAKAEEAGYIVPADRTEAFGRTETNDLLAAIEREARGTKVYTLEKQDEFVNFARLQDELAQQRDLIQTAPKAVDDILRTLFRGGEDSVPAAVRKIAMKAISRGVDPETAVDDALEAWARQTMDLPARPPEPDIPFGEDGIPLAPEGVPGMAKAVEDLTPEEINRSIGMESQRAQAETLMGERQIEILDEETGQTVNATDYMDALNEREKELAQLMVCVMGDMTEGAV